MFPNDVIRDALAAESCSAEFASAAAYAWIDRHTLAGLQAGDIGADLTNDSGGIGSGNLRKRYFDAGHSAPQKDIDVVDRRAVNFNKDFAGSRRGFRHIFITKHVGRSVF